MRSFGHKRGNKGTNGAQWTFIGPQRYPKLLSCGYTYHKHLQLVSLLTSRQLAELLLWNASSESLETTENLSNSLSIELLSVRLLDQRLDVDQRRADQVRAHTVINLSQHSVQELGVSLLEVEDLVDVAGLDKVINSNALGHDERLVGLCYAETGDKAHGSTALGDKADGGEWSQEEGVGDGVDEVGETGQSSGETDCWAIESSDEDLWVGVEGLGNVEVVGDEAGQEVTVNVGSLCNVTAEGDISSAGDKLATAVLFGV